MLPSVKELLAFGRHTPAAYSARRARAARSSSDDDDARDKSPGAEGASAPGRGLVGSIPGSYRSPGIQPQLARQRPGRKTGAGDRDVSSSRARQYRCGVHSCAAIFKRPEHLKRHMLTHTQARPFRCSIESCGKRFSRRDNYITHSRKHEQAEQMQHTVESPEEHMSRSPSSTTGCKLSASELLTSSKGSSASSSPRGESPCTARRQATSSIFGLLNQEGLDNTDGRGRPKSAGALDRESSKPGHSAPGPSALGSLELLAYASMQTGTSVASPTPETQPALENTKPASISRQSSDDSVKGQPQRQESGAMSVTVALDVAADPAKPFMCSLCESRFGRMEHVKRHQLVHTGERGFKCPTCKKTFARKDNMVQHLRAHRRKMSQTGSGPPDPV